MKETMIAFLSAAPVTFNLDRWAAHWLKEDFISAGFSSIVFFLKLEQRNMIESPYRLRVEKNVSLNSKIKQRNYH